jgi:protein-disulfide isomerase
VTHQPVTQHPATTEPEAPAARNPVLLIVLGVLGVISAVIAGLVIFSSGEGPAQKPEAVAPVRAGDQAVLVGKSSAPTKVTVYEDFGDPESRALEIASRDFLRIDAAQGHVQVEYRPFVAGDDLYSADAGAAWVALLGSGTPKQALTFHDLVFDRQPEPGATEKPDFVSWAAATGINEKSVLDAMASPDATLTEGANQAAARAGITRAPVVLVDGKPVTADSPVALADKLQRMLLAQ